MEKSRRRKSKTGKISFHSRSSSAGLSVSRSLKARDNEKRKTKSPPKKTKQSRSVSKEKEMNNYQRDEEIYTSIMEDTISRIKNEALQLTQEKENLEKEIIRSTRNRKKLEKQFFLYKKEMTAKVSKLDKDYNQLLDENTLLVKTNKKLNKSMQMKERTLEAKDKELLNMSTKMEEASQHVPDSLKGEKTVVIKKGEVIVPKKQFKMYEMGVKEALKINNKLRKEMKIKTDECEEIKEELEVTINDLNDSRNKVKKLEKHVEELSKVRKVEDMNMLKIDILKKALADALRKVAQYNLGE